MNIQRYKGTRDLNAAEMGAFRLIEGVFRRCCQGWGFTEVRTPTIEYLNLFTSAGRLAPHMLTRVYSFLDWDGWSGERVVLRPDGTIPVVRMYLDSPEKSEVARCYYVTNIFIFDETGSKNREKWQCGAELIGNGSPLADVELITLALEVLHGLGLTGVEVRLSHAGLIKAVLSRLELGDADRRQWFERILGGEVSVLENLKGEDRELGSVLIAMLNLKGRSPGFISNLKALVAGRLPEIEPYLDDFRETVSLLDALGCPYSIEIASGTSFEYYTGIIFQFYLDGEKVGGGGRYDSLVRSMGGGDVPASGFALYLERLMSRVPGEASGGAGRVVISPLARGGIAFREAFALAGRLRERGYVVLLDGVDGGGAEARWLLAGGGGGAWELRDRLRDTCHIVARAEDVLALLEGKGAAQDSPA